jgi:hypothetical protein
MLGLPLIPTEQIDVKAEAAFFPLHALKDEAFRDKLIQLLMEGKPVLITDGLAQHLENIENKNLHVLDVNMDPKNLLRLSREELNNIRDPMLKPFGVKLDAPGMLAFYLMGDDLIVIENFNDKAVAVTLETEFSMDAEIALVLPQTETVTKAFSENQLSFTSIPARTLVVVKY